MAGTGPRGQSSNIEHLLDDLSIDRHATLLPWDAQAGCRHLRPGLADAIYLSGDGNRAAEPEPASGSAPNSDRMLVYE